MEVDNGYAGRLLRVDLSSGVTTVVPTSDYAEKFVGGRGIGTKVYWDEVGPDVGPFDPGNRLVFMTGPATGIAPAGARWWVNGRSPAGSPQGFSYATMAGSWGAFLKAAGFDGVIVYGQSERPVYLFVQDGAARIRDASSLWGRGAVETRSLLKGELGQAARVAAIGQAGESQVLFAGILADGDAFGGAGFGAVMGSKKLKAIAVSGSRHPGPADRQALRGITARMKHLLGTTPRVDPMLEAPPEAMRDPCYACIGCDMRLTHQIKDGTSGKFACAGGAFYQAVARKYYGRPTDVPFLVNRLCDDYGVDVHSVTTTITLLGRGAAAGLISEKEAGVPISRIGSLEFMQTLLRKVVMKEGIGQALALGPVRAAERLGASRVLEASVCDSLGHVMSLDPRLLLYTGLTYIMEPRYCPSQTSQVLGHGGCLWSDFATGKPGAYLNGEVMRAIGRRFWGGEQAVDFSTYDGKALAARIVQDRAYSSDCLVLCLWMFPISDSEYTEDHVGDPAIESRLLSAIVGKPFSEQDLDRVGERIANLQRAVLLREGGRGRQTDNLAQFYFTTPLKNDWTVKECLVPGKNGEVLSRKGQVLDRQKFEDMKSQFYALRGWDVPSGLPTVAGLRALGLADVAADLASRGLARP